MQSNPVGRPKSGQVPEGYIRFNANVRKDLHLRLKLHSVRSGRAMGEILEEWIEKHTPEL